MREWIIIVVMITFILLIMTFPKKEAYTFINHEQQDIIFYQVTIDGAVEKPGTYTIFEPMTLEQILKFAMGLRSDADISHVDMSKIYDSKSDIYIPSQDEEVIDILEKININKANFQTLLTIPGIQERQAASIVVYREANGLFLTLDELINVNHIGPATLEKIRPYLTT